MLIEYRQTALWWNWLTFHPTFPKLSVLDEPRKHLSFHEEVQEVANTSGGMGFTEWLPLKYTLPTLSDSHVQRIMSHQLHKKPDKCFGHQRVECHIWCKNKLIRKKRKERRKKKISPLIFVFKGTLALLMKVTPRKSQIIGMRINIGLRFLSYPALSMTYKEPMAYVHPHLHFFAHIPSLHPSAQLAQQPFLRDCSFRGHREKQPNSICFSISVLL